MSDSDFSFLNALSDLAERLPIWIMALAALLFLSLPLGLAALAGATDELLRDAQWRPLLLPPTIIIYCFMMVPYLRQSGTRVAVAMRPLIMVDDDTYDRIVADAIHVQPRNEAIAFGTGILFGLFIWQLGGDDGNVRYPMISSLVILLSLVMFGMMGWCVYLGISRSHLTAELHRCPMQIDIFDIAPFAAIGRQSLMFALTWVGGTILSLVFTFDVDSFLTISNLIVYGALALVTFGTFFLNMRHSHRALSAEKKRELNNAEEQINLAFRQLQTLVATGGDTSSVTREINAWTTMEQRLKATRTWPYNTEMLRTLTVSALTPLAIGLSRIAIYFLQNNG